MSNIAKIYEDIKQKPYKYSFSQICFLLEKIHDNKKNFACGTALTEPIKLTPYIHAATASSTCIKFNEKRRTLIINLPSLIGYNAVLPSYYADKIFFQEKQNDFFLSDFFNIFQHRYYSIKYKLEKDFTQTLSNEEKFKEVLAICGINDSKLGKYLSPFLSILVVKHKNKAGLKILLENLVKANVEVSEFAYRWFEIPEKHQLTLNKDSLIEKAIGKRTKVNYAAIEIVFWFSSFSTYMDYINDRIKQKTINTLIKYFLNKEIEFTIKLKIKKHTTKTFSLDKKNQLGITTWL